ncbi:serine hydrolase domain-containing protein [Phenylobacterium sp.]|jgi:CubicO group peptidase (beta-lactamase class C family)|uniref:serine hydrolase domain-containing protein n=1 Tax=Phenylobacterium sp. TaxID=1871053 RepID=UPI002F40A6BA
MRILSVTLAAAAVLACAAPSRGAPLSAQQQADIDASVGEWLAKTGAPSVSIAVVSGGELAYAKAYGSARLSPKAPATTTTRYAIDSISKEFTAAAVLKLQEEGKLSLDDDLARYLPDLAKPQGVTIRQALSHTAGFRDYWPQDFVTAEMTRPASIKAIIDEWGGRPLDFAPGSDWQYSNTGFVIAGAIVEKVSGQPLISFLKANVFEPLHMAGVVDADQQALPAGDAGAYTRWGDGPVRPAQKEAPGWLFGAAELGMAPSDLARWDVSLMARSLLAQASYDAYYTPVKLKDGKDSHYSLGLNVRDDHGRLQLSHDGGGSGFLSSNIMWPGQKTAVIAFTNNDWASPDDVAARVAFVVLPPTEVEARARAVFRGFQAGTLDRSLFTDNGNAYLSASVLADQKAGLAAYGPVRLFTLESEFTRGGFKGRIWKIVTAKAVLSAVERGYPDGKLEQFMISRSVE